MPNRNPVLIYGPRLMERAKQFSGPMITEIRLRCFRMIEGLVGLDPRIAGFAPSRLTFVEYGFSFRLHRSAPREWVVEIESEPSTPPRRRPRRPSAEASERVRAQAERIRRPRITRLRRMLSNLVEILGITRIDQGTTLIERGLAIIYAGWGLRNGKNNFRLVIDAARMFAASRTKAWLAVTHGQVAQDVFRYPLSKKFVHTQVLTLLARECGANIGMPLTLSTFEQVSYRPDMDEGWDVSWFGERIEERELVL